MAGLLVYIPGSTSNDSDSELVRVGLDSLLDRNVATIPTSISNSGPDGGSGRLITFDMGPQFGDTPRVVDLKTQEWKPAPPDPEKRTECAAGRYWIGYVKAARPTPDELQRPTALDGEFVELSDGQRWLVPIADYCPQRLTFDVVTGKEISVPENRHREFVEKANKIFAHFLSDAFHEKLKTELTAEVPCGLSFAGLALSKNYRINSVVVDALELVGNVQAFEIARVAVGMRLLERALEQKKNLPL